MEETCRVVLKIWLLVLALHLSVAALSFTHCDARISMHIVGEGGARHPPRVRERGSSFLALWCVAKPTVPDPIIQEAMNYACGSEADCNLILPSGSCFQPDTLLSHASYAFNSYWQRTKVAGGTRDFGGTTILVTVDPSNLWIKSYVAVCLDKECSLYELRKNWETVLQS